MEQYSKRRVVKPAARPGEWNSIGFGLEVRRLREMRGRTIRELADALGCEGTGPAWKLETGLRQTVPGPLAMRRLGELLEVEVADLLRLAGYDLERGP